MRTPEPALVTEGSPAAGKSNADSPPVEPAVARWIANAERSVLRQMVELVSQPGVVSMAGGLPSPEVFPRSEFAAAYDHVLRSEPRALQYLPEYKPLKEQIAALCARRGVHAETSRILLTTGAQQALDICARLLIDEGDSILAEAQAYTGIHQVIAPRGGQLVGLQSDLTDGLAPELVERAAQQRRPALLYAIPEGHNPLGVTLATERRQKLTEIAARYGFPILEDDPYGFLTYDGEAAPALAAADPDNVIYVGSFSKILGPALRLGWMVVPERWATRARIIKEGLDLECSSLTQRVVAQVLASDESFFDSHLERLRANYRPRRDAILSALDDASIPNVRFSRPSSGMFVWMQFDEANETPGFDTRDVLRTALEQEQLAFIPGAAFDGKGELANAGSGRLGLRLSFSLLPPRELTDAVQRLARAIATARQNPRPSSDSTSVAAG